MATSETHPRRRSWIAKYTPRPGGSSARTGISGPKERETPFSYLPTPTEGEELSITSPPPSIPTTPTLSRSNSTANVPLALTRSSTYESPPTSRPVTPRRRSATAILTSSLSKPLEQPLEQLDQQASQLILNALERTNSTQPTSPSTTLKAPDMNQKGSGSFGKMSFSSMMGGLSSLSLSRTSTQNGTLTNASSTSVDDKDKESRGRSMASEKHVRSSSHALPETETSRSRSRARSQSPFTFRRFRNREPSPTPEALPMSHSDIDLSDSSLPVRPRTSFADDPDSGDEPTGEMDGETEDEEWSDDDIDMFDPVTERNTERNALIEPVIAVGDGIAGQDGDVDVDIDPDPLGEGVNVVVPPEPYFPSTLNTYSSGLGGSSGSMRGKRSGPRRRKSTRHHEPLSYHTSRPIFQRDRCTITVTQGDPDGRLDERRRKRYVVASDLSEESRYAVEWGIGTVLRDGDEMLIVTVVENEAKVDPPIPNAADRATKLRSQQERQGLSYILVRQATSLLQRTKLNVSVSCQAWHAKNARHMLLDIVDYNEPTMLIVGSRGLGQLKGILLGSTSHYLIQKCAVPVMVARRRLKRPPKRYAHLAKHRVHVSLAEAGIDRVAPKVDQDVRVMRDEMQRDDDRRDGGPPQGEDDERGIEEEGDGDDDGEEEGDEGTSGVKVAG